MYSRRNIAWGLALLLGAAWTGPAAAAGGAGDAAAEKKVDQAINTHYFETKFDQAEKTLRQALTECGNTCSPEVQAKVLMYLGIVLANGKQDKEGAKAAFGKAAELDPKVAFDVGLGGEDTEKLFKEAAASKANKPSAPATAKATTSGGVSVDTGDEGEEEEEEEETEEEGPASVSGFGASGQFAFSIRRLFGFFSYSFTMPEFTSDVGAPVPETKYSGTNLSILGAGSAAPMPIGTNAFALPHLAVDYFVVDRISAGLGLAYAKSKIDGTPDTETGAPQDASSQNLVVHLRAGYAYTLNELMTLWPRLGVSIVKQHTLDVNTASGAWTEIDSAFQDIGIELPLVVTLIPNVGFTAGLVVDYGFGGSQSKTEVAETATIETTSAATFTSFGVEFGMFVYL